MEAKPYLTNLENFGRTVLEDLWTAVVEHFVEVSYFDDRGNPNSALPISCSH